MTAPRHKCGVCNRPIAHVPIPLVFQQHNPQLNLPMDRDALTPTVCNRCNRNLPHCVRCKRVSVLTVCRLCATPKELAATYVITTKQGPKTLRHYPDLPEPYATSGYMEGTP